MMADIFDPIKIGKLEAKNRIMFAPTMTNFANLDGSVSDKQVQFLRRIAEGGVGIIVKGHAYIDEIASKGYKRMQGCHRSNLGLDKIVQAVKRYGCLCILQLNHIGPKADPSLTKGPPRGPSPQTSHFLGRPVEVQMLSIEEIEEIVKAFGEAAARAQRAGFDGVEVHGAHNYLISQFLSPNYNFRSDKYGGSLDGRMHFMLEVISSIKEHVSNDFVLGFRLNGAELIEGGLPLEDGLKIAQVLEKAGVDYLSVSQTSTVKLAAFTTTYHPLGSFIYIPETIKKNVSIPVAGVGALHQPELIRKALEEKKMDLVAICRGLIADPDIVKKIKEGESDEQRLCIRCNFCLERTWNGQGIMCTVNPMVSRELRWDLDHVPQKKKVMVVGGGVAGMEAARVAVMKGHDVTLCEMKDHLGGQALAASVPQFTEVFKYLIRYYEAALSRLGIMLKLRHKVSVEEINKVKPDVVILATGAEEKFPDIPGIASSHVKAATPVLSDKSTLQRDVAVVGGSMIGCQVTLYFAENNERTVKLISKRRKEEFGSELEYGNQVVLLDLIERTANIEIHDQTELQRITEKGIFVRKPDGSEELSVDYVVFADEFVPKNLKYQGLNKEITVLRAGDCVTPKNLLSAIHGGARAAYKIS
jgi:2,4-dienoyl-CoA reductase-like NADH-dependent reductase (Old Yellow Enzyme family)/thioredoxin reductase